MTRGAESAETLSAWASEHRDSGYRTAAGLAVVALALVMPETPLAAQQAWTSMAPLPAVCGQSGRPSVWTGPPMNRLLVWGGVTSSGYSGEGCSYDPTSNVWTVISKVGAPTPRAGHSAVWTGTEMIVWGGYGSEGPPTTGSGARYDPATDSWSPVARIQAPIGRQGHSAVWTGSKMIVWGGALHYLLYGSPTGSGAMYDPVANAWTPISERDQLDSRTGHSAIWTGSRFLVWGGVDGWNQVRGDGALYDPETDTWTRMGGTPPSQRLGHTTVWTGSQLIVWGGRSSSAMAGLGNGGIYDPGSDTWTAIPESGGPAGRYAHSAVWTGSRMVVWGGMSRGPSGDAIYGDGALFDPVRRVWSSAEAMGAPAARSGHHAAWTGSEMLAWGGFDAPSSFLADGGRWIALDPSARGTIADFKVTPGSPIVGNAATFTDLSSGPPTSWSWSFGDQGSSTAQHPSHVFEASGTYVVSLLVSDGRSSSTRVNTVTVKSAAPPPVITSFVANPPTVSAGQQTTLSWASVGGTTASIDPDVGSVPTTGSRTITPRLGVSYWLTVTGPGGSARARVTVDPAMLPGMWLLPSAARVTGLDAFWTTDIAILNTSNDWATVYLKFLGHEGKGEAEPELVFGIRGRSTLTMPDVLRSEFGRESDYGPILIRASGASLVVQGQTWTAGESGGSYGQSVPALAANEMVGATPKAIAGVRQDAEFRTNLVFANAKSTNASVSIVLLRQDGEALKTRTLDLGPYGFAQLNLLKDFGVSDLTDGSVLISCVGSGCSVAAYASVINAATSDPRTHVAR